VNFSFAQDSRVGPIKKAKQRQILKI